MPLASNDALQNVYRQPGKGPIDKAIDSLDQHCADAPVDTGLSTMDEARERDLKATLWEPGRTKP